MNDDTVLKIREFNRFYLSVMNLYGNNYAGGHYSITETRVLYEIHRHEGCSAEYIAKKLHIDKGYLSRIIKRFESKEILERQKSEKDARLYEIRLTQKGGDVIEELIQSANQEIRCIIHSLPDSECGRLENAMKTIEEVLTGGNGKHENYTI